MVVVSTGARIAIALCCLVLLVPMLGMPLQQATALEQLLNRSLEKWPDESALLGDPVQYLGQARRWLADRAYPLIGASLLSNKVLYLVFGTAPQRRVTLGNDGFVFLNGHSDAAVFGLFANLCIEAQSEAASERLRRALPSFARFAKQRGIAVDVIVVPTTATLYGDNLPASVPLPYRDACRKRASGDSPLLRVAPAPGMTFLYPFSQMQALRNIEGFYPKGNFHASGMSLKVVRDAYLALLGVDGVIDDRLIRGSAPAEILASYGIVDERPVYFVRNDHVRRDPARQAILAGQISDLYAHPFDTNYYVNLRPVIPESALLVSDSFGDRAAEVFAGAFTSMFQVPGSLPNERLAGLIDRLARVEGTRRVILLVQEGGVEQIVAWAEVLGH